MKRRTSCALALLLLAALLAGCAGPAPLPGQPTPTALPTPEPAVIPSDIPVGELTQTDTTYYVNQTLGFGCSLNDDWFMISQDDPQQSAAAGHVSFVDFSAQKRDGLAGLNIAVEDVTLPGGRTESPETYRDNSIPAVQEMLESFGCTNIHLEANTFAFLGQEYPGIRFQCTTPRQEWYCQQFVIGCGHYTVTVSLSTYDGDWIEELAGLFYPLTGAAETGSSHLPEPGVIEAGEYRQPFFGLGISVEGWEMTDRDEIGNSIFGIPDYASATVEELLANHIPYVDVMMTRGNTTVQLMLEKPPVTSSDGSVSNTPAEYMDANERTIPAIYGQISSVSQMQGERFQRELCGMEFEGFRFHVRSGETEIYQTMLTTEKDGVFFTVYITCVEADETEEILAGFFALEE